MPDMGTRHRLTNTGTYAQTCTDSGKSAFILCRKRNGFGGLILGVTSQIADNAHRNFLIQRSLNRRGQGNAFNRKVFQRQTQLGKFRTEQFANFCDSKTWFAAISKNGIPELPNAAANWVTAILRSWFSKSTPLYCAATPLTSLKNFAGSLMR